MNGPRGRGERTMGQGIYMAVAKKKGGGFEALLSDSE